MKKQAILLDLDNTLYNYDKPHNKGLSAIFSYCGKHFNFSAEEFRTAYIRGREKVHIELSETASSHNRLLYIQKMLESLEISPFEHALKLYNAYWDTFLEEMKLYDGVVDFFEKYNGKICVVTDLTAHIQYRKIKKLNIGKYIQFIVTSEESGREKPHAYPFMLALEKLRLKNKDVFMVGDSFKKDIVGALNIGIESYWLNSNQTNELYDDNLVTEIKSFKELLELI
ncbi:HAD family hydrolase [Flavobacteriales bacterium]|nr:HAD family hydrolase [Flavobacteriales bacterium]